jgi:large subunit ribosomal protein L15
MDFILTPPEGSKRKRKRVGRGTGSGRGKTSTRGHKGQKSRSGGGSPYVGYEGGQTPLQRRLPKRGFTNIFCEPFDILNLPRLNIFNDGDTIDPELLKEKGLLPKASKKVKLLGNGDIEKKLTIKVHQVSSKAKEKLEKAGCTLELITTTKESPKKATGSKKSKQEKKQKSN